MMTHTPIIKQQSGYSLVELMVALGLGAVILASVLSIFAESRKTDLFSEEISRNQEAGRFAINHLSKQVRMAGYQGCADPTNIDVRVIANDFPAGGEFQQLALQGYEVSSASWATGTDFAGTTAASDALVGTDVLAIMRGVSEDVSIDENETVNNANIHVTGDSTTNFSRLSLVMISDCESADLFRITSNGNNTWAHANGTNSDNRLSQLYGTDAQIMSFSYTAYYVANTGRVDSQGNPINALYQAKANVNTTGFTSNELIEGIDNLQVTYGELLATGNIAYNNASSVADWSAVKSVRLGILISGTRNATEFTDVRTYNLPDQNITAVATPSNQTEHSQDRRYRRTYTATIQLRNRAD